MDSYETTDISLAAYLVGRRHPLTVGGRRGSRRVFSFPGRRAVMLTRTTRVPTCPPELLRMLSATSRHWCARPREPLHPNHDHEDQAPRCFDEHRR